MFRRNAGGYRLKTVPLGFQPERTQMFPGAMPVTSLERPLNRSNAASSLF